jgi:hypothetical protein
MKRTPSHVWIVIAFALIAPACGGSDAGPAGSGSAVPASSADITADVSLPPLVVDGIVSDGALDAALTADGDIDAEVLASYAEDFSALTDEQQHTAVADLSLRAELELAKVSGLDAALGGAAATEAALTAASAQILDQADTAAAAVSASGEPQGVRLASTAAPAPPSGGGGAVAVVGLFLGFMALSLMAGVVTDASNTFEAGESDVFDANGSVGRSTVDESIVEITYSGKEGDVDVDFSAGAVLQPCPGPDGTFTIDAEIDVKASSGGAGQNARLKLKIDGRVDDNAELAEQNIENNVQWSDFAGGKGQFVDFTMSGPNGAENFVGNRSGGNVTDAFYTSAAILATLVGLTAATKLLETAERAWTSGRCVKLNVTPSAGPTGLSPSEVVDVRAEPRSKVDGQPTGGNVTATLSAGGTSVEPNGSPVPADADVVFTAPGEADQKASVAVESRSRRGVGKAGIDFDTKRRGYTASGGGTNVTISGTIAALDAPFTLDAEFIGGNGTFAYSGDENGGIVTVEGGGGGATVSGDGTYTIADNDDGTKALTQTVSACVDVSGVCNTDTQVITLTPLA